MGSGLDKIKRKAPDKVPDKNSQDIYTLPFVYRYSIRQSNTDSDYMNIGDVCRKDGTQIITIPLDSAASSQDNSEDPQYMNIDFVSTSCKNGNVLQNSTEADIRHESDVRQAETDRHISENVMVDVHNVWEESDYESLTDSQCDSAHSTCAINQICRNHERLENIPKESVMSKEDPISLLPIMAEVFRQEIVDSIRVSEILPYLSLHVDKGRLQCMERSSTKEAASSLLDEIIASPEPGKWTTFLDALKRAGYEYIARKLMGETEADLTVQKWLLQIFTPHIVDNLDPKQLTDSLFAKDLISIADKEEIENKQKFENTTAATLVLLDRIPRRKDNWFTEFVVTLRDCGYKFVADEINIQECIPSHVCNDNQNQTLLKPNPCANRPASKVARQKSASDEEAQCWGNVCEEDTDEEEKQFIKEKELLMKTRDKKQREAQRLKEISSLKQHIKELENEEMEREEIKKQESLRQEKEALLKMLDKKKQLVKFQQEIEQLKKSIAEVENAGNISLQEAYNNEEKYEGQNQIKNTRYIEIEHPGQTPHILAGKAELEEMMKELLRNKIVPDIITTVTSEITKALQNLYNENNLDYANIMRDLKSLKFDSLQPAPVLQNDTLSMEAMKDIEHDYDIAT